MHSLFEHVQLAKWMGPSCRWWPDRHLAADGLVKDAKASFAHPGPPVRVRIVTPKAPAPRSKAAEVVDTSVASRRRRHRGPIAPPLQGSQRTGMPGCGGQGSTELGGM